MQVKSQIKQFLLRSGLWYQLNLLKMTPSILSWLRSGCSNVAPHPIKMMIVQSYIQKFSLNNFVETGTYLGDTLGYIAKDGVQCISIELSPELYEKACQRFNGHQNVRLVQGDSGQKIPELLKEINTPTVFWLDGHYSSGITAQAEFDTPISAELQAVIAHDIKHHVILIDDAHCFDGTNNYPHLDELLKVIRENGNYKADVSTDIIRIIPRLVA